MYSNAVDKGDCFAFSKTTAKNFVYSTDVTFKKNQGAAALIFRSNNNLDNKECYAVNIDGYSHKCKFWLWQENSDYQLIDEKEVKATDVILTESVDRIIGNRQRVSFKSEP